MSYLSLEEAAAKLGITTDRLVELRSEGQIRGFRDGASWKFPDTEIDRMADELADQSGFGNGILGDDDVSIDELEMSGDSASLGKVIGGDLTDDGDGSDLNIGSEAVKEGSTGGSDVNLVTGGSTDDGSDVSLVPSDSGKLLDELDDSEFDVDSNLIEIDSAELQLDAPALLAGESDAVEIAIDPKEGSTGPVAKADIEKAASSSNVDAIDLASEEKSGSGISDLAFDGLSEEDSDDLVLGDDSEDSLDLDVLSGDDLAVKPAGASSLELMNELDSPSGEVALNSSGADVLSELDLLGDEKAGGSGLISGDSENLLTSSGLGSGLGSSVLGEMDDALDDDDDLVIADDDAELMLDSVSDISVAGDSGINLMSPSDSGLSLESEPLDLAGSSLSALDLGAELTDGSGISSGSDAGGSAVDFAASDEEFQLSPSGVGLDGDIESSSQVIEVEDSEVVADAVEFVDDFGDDAGFADAGFAAPAAAAAGDVFGDADAVADDGAMGEDPMAGEVMAMEDDAPAMMATAGMAGYEVPFTLMQCLSLMFIVLTLALGGMLMTDLVRNMWAYSETSAPVSSLTDALVDLMGWGS